MTIEQIGFAIAAFVCGAVPFSVWVGRIGPGVDIRNYGDGNPGAFNVLRAGGLKWGALALMLDISKGATPVGLAYYVIGWDGVAIAAIALAPLLGHAFSPFLNFRGGKAIATTFGIWIGLTLWTVPVGGAITLVVAYKVLDSSAWAVVVSLVAMLLVLILTSASGTLFVVWLGNLVLIIARHYRELTHLPGLRIKFTTQADTL